MGDEQVGRDREEGAATGTEAAAETDISTQDAEGRGGRAPAGPEATTEAAEAVDDVVFHGMRCAIVHQAREGFLDACHRLGMFLVLVSGSGAVYALTHNKDYALLVAMVPAVVGALDMALNFSTRARQHAELHRRYLELVAEAQRSGAESHAADLNARLTLLYAQEPPDYKALDALAHNQVCEGRGRGECGLRVAPPYRLLRHVFRFQGKTFLPKEEPESGEG